jgi:hypothetical protein
MKYFLLLSVFITTFGLQGALGMDLKEQSTYLKKTSKKERDALYKQGCTNISSTFRSMGYIVLEYYIKQNDSYMEPLNHAQINMLHACVAEDNCRLYLIELASEYQSGYEVESVFIMLNMQSKNHVETRHIRYEE